MKKFLLVLCVALLLTAVCTSAMAWVTDPNLKSAGKRLSDYNTSSTYNGHYVRDVVVLENPSCTKAGSARIDTWFTEYDPGTGIYTKTSDPGPSSIVSIDAGHKYSGGEDGEGWVNMDTPTKDCTKVSQKRVCEVCGQAETREKSIAANHIFVIKAVPGKEPTCTTKGWAQSICEVCGAVNPQNPNPFEMDKTDHVYSIKVTDKAETCETEGKGHYECEFCGKPKPGLDGKTEYFTIPAHTFTAASKEVIDEPATCFKAGKSHKVCALCGLSEKDSSGNVVYNTIPQLTHEYGNWVTKKAASCVDGLEQRVCALCGNVETRTIPKNDEHTWVEYFKNDGNCTRNAAGEAVPSTVEKWRKCAVCGADEYVADESTMTVHQFVSDTSKAGSNIPPECVGGKAGKEYLKCSFCGGTWEREIPALKEHNFGAWVCVVAPGKDGSENGVWERTCTNYHCIEKQTYVGKTAPQGGSTPTTPPAPTTTPTDTPTGTENYKFTSWSFNGSSVSGSVAGNVSYRTPGLSVNVIIYTPTGTFLAVNAPVDEDGHFSVSAGGAVYAVSVQLKDNSKTYQTDGKYV